MLNVVNSFFVNKLTWLILIIAILCYFFPFSEYNVACVYTNSDYYLVYYQTADELFGVCSHRIKKILF